MRNSIIREGCELSVLERIKRNALKWFSHVERMGKERLVRRVSVSSKCERDTTKKIEG